MPRCPVHSSYCNYIHQWDGWEALVGGLPVDDHWLRASTMYHLVTSELHSIRTEDLAAHSENSQEDHRGLPPLDSQHLPEALSPQRFCHCEIPLSPVTQPVYASSIRQEVLQH